MIICDNYTCLSLFSDGGVNQVGTVVKPYVMNQVVLDLATLQYFGLSFFSFLFGAWGNEPYMML